VWIVRRDGTDAHFVAAGTTPAFSPDGARLAIGGAQTAFNRSELVVVDTDGGGRRVLVQDAAAYPHPSWSPDGTQIAFVGLTREQMDFTNVRRVKSDGTGETGIRVFGADPSWSPDGRWIAYTENGDRSFTTELHLVRPDGSGDRLLVRLPRLGATVGAWTETGAIIFTTLPPNQAGTASAAGGELWQVDAKGRALHPLAPHCIFGTSTSDHINGTRLADRVYALEGNDVINVRGGGRDRVDCGPGRDTVLADRVDLVRDCERIVR
jgi:dipeptidyl aminopeptidase/acylaminoacyl peptidase